MAPRHYLDWHYVVIDFYYTYYGEHPRVPLEDLACFVSVNTVLPVLIIAGFVDEAMLST